MARTIIVYSQPGWLFCGKAKEFLSQRGVAFEERDITKDPAAVDELERLGAMTTPVIVIDGEAVIGFNQKRLEELLTWNLKAQSRGYL